MIRSSNSSYIDSSVASQLPSSISGWCMALAFNTYPLRSYWLASRHPNVLHLIGVSPLDAELAFLVFNDGLFQHFGLINEVSTTPFDRHRMGRWIYDRVRTVQGTRTKCVLGTPNGMGCTPTAYANSHCLLGCRPFGTNVLNSWLSLDWDQVDITVLQSGLNYLRVHQFPFASVGLDVSDSLRKGSATKNFVALRRSS